MKQNTLIEVTTPMGEGMYIWKKMNHPFHIGSAMSCFFKNGGIEVHIHPEGEKKSIYQISPQDWIKGHELAVADGFKVRFKGKNFNSEWKHGKHLEWNENEIGKTGFIAAAVMLGIGTYFLPKDDSSTKVPEIEEIATIRLTTGESGLVAFQPTATAEAAAAASAAAASAAADSVATNDAAPAIETAPAIAAAPAPEPASAPASAPSKKAAAPIAAAAPEPIPVNQAFSSKNGGKNQAGASVAKAPAPNAAALLLSRRMASLQKGLQKVMSNPAGTGAIESSDDSAPIQSGSKKTSSLANSISTSSEGKTGGSVYGGMKNQVAAGTGNGSLSGGSNFDIKNTAGRGGAGGGIGGGSGIQLVQTSVPQVNGGKLNVAVIQKTFQKNMNQLRNCFEAANIKTATLKINLEFTITKSGGVMGQKTLPGSDRQPASVEQKQLETCILNRMAGWKFDTGNLDSNVVIEYPLTFRSLSTGDE